MRVVFENRPYRSEKFCGDQAGYWEVDGHILLCMVDGLGHGKLAEEAGRAAVEYVGSHLTDTMQELFAGCNAAIGHTRGVAMGIACIDLSAGTLDYAGIGNPRAMIYGPNRRKIVHLSSDPGIIGGGYRNLIPELVQFFPNDTVVMSTDGIEELIDMSVYNRSELVDPGIIARNIIEDWGDDSDDRGVLVYMPETV
jgi:phosphoserine phosphatase RsbX